MTEEWRPIPGWEGYYSVSNQGRVRSEARTIIRVDGLERRYRERVLRAGLNSSDRYSVRLHADGVGTTRLVHQLVAEAFVPNPEGHPFVRHLDDNHRDNRASNLAWGTPSENQYDRVRNGIYTNGMTEWTRCREGHEYTEANTYRPPFAANQRRCRECTNRRARDRRKRAKEVSFHGL